MADEKKAPDTSSSLLFVLVVSFIIFSFFTRTPKEELPDGILRQIIPASESRTKAPVSKNTSSPSKTKQSVTLSSGNVKTDKVEEEYLRLKASRSNNSAVNITNWQLRSLTRFELRIPPAVRTLYTGIVNPTQAVLLEPGEEALIHSGRSPLGVSFRENMCSGYLNQYQNFYPRFNESNCPDNRDQEHLMIAAGLEDRCINYINSQPRCRYPSAVSSNLSRICRNYIHKNLNYNACVTQNANRPDFYTGTWRIYLGQTRDVWKSSRESIFLLDATGQIVDTYRY